MVKSMEWSYGEVNGVRYASRSKESEVEAENFVAAHDPSSDNWQWKIYDTVYDKHGETSVKTRTWRRHPSKWYKVITVDISQNDNRMFGAAYVNGFSFRLKKWGCVSVIGFSEIGFNDSPYDDLVQEHLKEGRNNLESEENDRVDRIDGKGEGCISLCYGPPGTGKTLTAESLSEKLNCPLWCLSAHELGITPDALEEKLVKVLDVVASWGAILLLDEADAYLLVERSSELTPSSRSSSHLSLVECLDPSGNTVEQDSM